MTQVVRSMSLVVRHAPSQGDRAPAVPKSFGTFYMCVCIDKQQLNFALWSNCMWENFTGSTTNADARSVCGS